MFSKGHIVETLWGGPTEIPFGSKKRKSNLQSLWKDYNYKDVLNKPSFEISNKRGDKRRICEASFLFLAGIIDSKNSSDVKNRQWADVKATHENRPYTTNGPKAGKTEIKSVQYTNAYGFILFLKSLHSGDDTAYACGATATGEATATATGVKALPYTSIARLFEVCWMQQT
jgi:hypothetical protein